MGILLLFIYISSDFPKTIKRHLKNDILMFRTASSVLHLLPIAGLYTFLPKYLESQFHLPAHDANLITGMGGILVMGIGIVASAVILFKIQSYSPFDCRLDRIYSFDVFHWYD